MAENINSMASAAHLTRSVSTCGSRNSNDSHDDSPPGLKMALKVERVGPLLQRMRRCWRHKRGQGQPEACPSAREVEERTARAGSHESEPGGREGQAFVAVINVENFGGIARRGRAKRARHALPQSLI